MSTNIKIETVINDLDRLKANAYGNGDKIKWINKVEGRIQTEILHTAEDQKVIYTDYDTDKTKELLVPHPYYDLYQFYLEAMVDYYNNEFSNYENSMIMFNNAFNDYSNFYLRETAEEDRNEKLPSIKNLW